MNKKTAKELMTEMETLEAALRCDQVTVFVCACCGQVAHAVSQPVFVPGREPITQVECHDLLCPNYMGTVSYRQSDAQAYEQAIARYTPVRMDASQVGRFIEAADYAARSA